MWLNKNNGLDRADLEKLLPLLGKASFSTQ
jgi:hypothetical protein